MKNIILILCLLSFGVKSQTIVKVEKLSDKTYKVVTDKKLDAGKTYNFIVVEKSLSEYKEGNVIIITPPVPLIISSKPTCANGLDFSVASVGYGNGQIDFRFNASNLSKGTYDLLKDGNSVKSGFFNPTSNIVIIQTGDLSNGNYTLKITGESCNGIAQKGFTISGNSPPIIQSGSVQIIEPKKPKYYFSNGHEPSFYDGNINAPVFFTNTNTYDPENDLVWLKNDKIKIGISLTRGGQIAWASLVEDSNNLVYNGYDGGFQVQLDAYQKKDGYVQNRKYSRAQYSEVGQYTNSTQPPYADNLTSYNVTQGGDFLNHAVSLIDYHKVGNNGYYIKVRPNFYTIDSELSETFIEVLYTLDGYALKCDYTYTSFRHDGQYDGSGFDGGHAPVCFLVNNLTKYKSYTGNNPWTHETPEDGFLPNETSGQKPLTKNSKERWALAYNPDNNKTIGVYANTNDAENSFGLKQKEVYDANGRQGGEFGGGYTVLGRNYDLVPFLSDFNRSKFTKTISSYLIIERNPNEFIKRVYEIAGH